LPFDPVISVLQLLIVFVDLIRTHLTAYPSSIAEGITVLDSAKYGKAGGEIKRLTAEVLTILQDTE